MSPKKECRAVYGLEHFPPEYYVTYTVESQNDINTRLRMQLMEETDGDPIHIINGSQVCKKNADYERVIRENAFKAFRAPIVRAIDRGGDKAKQLNKLYTRVYGREHPLRKFLDNHYDSITVIYGWAPSTIEHYWSTLTNQLIPHLRYAEIHQLTAQDFDDAVDKLVLLRRDQQNKTYSEERIAQFVSNSWSVMEYVSEYYGIPNVLEKSKYATDMRVRSYQEPLPKRIEKLLRPKNLDIGEELRMAKGVMDSIEKNPTDGLAVGTAVAYWTGLRPSEVCGQFYGHRHAFAQGALQNRHYMVVQTKAEQNGRLSPRLKTTNGYRGIPLPKVLDMVLDKRESAIQHECALDSDSIQHEQIVTRPHGQGTVKPRELSAYAKKTLKMALYESQDKLIMQVPMIANGEDGDVIRVDDNATAYQTRRNSNHRILSILGLPISTARALLGHADPVLGKYRWMAYCQEELAKIMAEQDKLIYFPISSEEERTAPWQQTDPRQAIKELGVWGEYQNEAALRMVAKAHSSEDKITIKLQIRANEPADPIKISGYAKTRLEMDTDVFYETLQHDKHVNDLNAYWDKVFGCTSQSWLERCRLSDEDAGEVEEEYYEAPYDDMSEEEWFFGGDDIDSIDEDFEDYDD